MRYYLEEHKPNETRLIRPFAWLPRRIGRAWIWLERYRVTQQWLDLDNDGRYQWVTIAVELAR